MSRVSDVDEAVGLLSDALGVLAEIEELDFSVGNLMQTIQLWLDADYSLVRIAAKEIDEQSQSAAQQSRE